MQDAVDPEGSAATPYAPFPLVPLEITLKIYQFLMAPNWNSNFLRYGAVCKEWRSIARGNGCYILRKLGTSRLLDLYEFLRSREDWSNGVKEIQALCRYGELAALAKVISVSPHLKTLHVFLNDFHDARDWDDEDSAESRRGQARVLESAFQLGELESLELRRIDISSVKLLQYVRLLRSSHDADFNRRGLRTWQNLRSLTLHAAPTGILTNLSQLESRHVPHLKEFSMPIKSKDTIAIASRLLSFDTIVRLNVGEIPFAKNKTFQGSWGKLERAFFQSAGRLLQYDCIYSEQDRQLIQSMYKKLVRCRELGIAFPFNAPRAQSFKLPSPSQLPCLRHLRIVNYTSRADDEHVVEQFLRSRALPLESLIIENDYCDIEDELDLIVDSRVRLEAVCQEIGTAFDAFDYA